MDYPLQALLDPQGGGSTLILCLSWCYALYIASRYLEDLDCFWSHIDWRALQALHDLSADP